MSLFCMSFSLSTLLFCTSPCTLYFTIVVRGLPPFQRFPHEPLWLTPGLDHPLVSIRRCILGTGLRCALEFRVVEFSRVSDPLRRIRYLRSDVNGSRCPRYVTYLFFRIYLCQYVYA